MIFVSFDFIFDLCFEFSNNKWLYVFLVFLIDFFDSGIDFAFVCIVELEFIDFLILFPGSAPDVGIIGDECSVVEIVVVVLFSLFFF